MLVCLPEGNPITHLRSSTRVTLNLSKSDGVFYPLEKPTLGTARQTGDKSRRFISSSEATTLNLRLMKKINCYWLVVEPPTPLKNDGLRELGL